MSSYPAPDLLVSYLATAAHEAQEGYALSGRSRWAIDSAREQLVWQYDAHVTAREDGVRGAVALVAAAGGRSQRLAELLVGNDGVYGGDEKNDATDDLASIIEDLDLLMSDKPGCAEAAARLKERFEAVAEELLSPSSEYYTAGDYQAALSA